MHRYYMNAETRDALIAESKRMIAARAPSAATADESAPAESAVDERAASASNDERGRVEDAGTDSTFAALVSDLRYASAAPCQPFGPLELLRSRS